MILEEIEKYAKENSIPIIQEEGKEFLLNTIKEEKIKSILEIGSAIGYSAIVMANLDKDINIDTIERDDSRYQIAVENIKNTKLEKQIKLIKTDALTFDITNLKHTYDLLFVDGAKAQSQKFIEKYEELLNKNAIILIDNINFHGFANDTKITTNRNTKQLVRKIKEFKKWMLNNNQYDAKLYEVGDGIILARKK
ncbi:O-methyltransferase [Mycoplasma sp. P36-A1]|uniref:O-methyltransferase n=1 Tax=Mycoplasma sp. P36-A1 TaxID=3252900 RepID=UPI003C2E0D5F